MELQTTPIEGLLLIRPRVFEDDRGSFSLKPGINGRLTRQRERRFAYKPAVCPKQIVLQQLHFQVPPHAQGKLVRVVRGSVVMWPWICALGNFWPTSRCLADWGEQMAVLRSARVCARFHGTGGRHGVSLSVHGDRIHPDSEQALLWNDPDLGIEWGMKDPKVSPRRECSIICRFQSPLLPSDPCILETCRLSRH